MADLLRIRMYRPGFGDCFLLSFPKQEGGCFQMLIDCGVHGQYRGGADRMREVVKKLRQHTDGHLDVVAVTHEHADHVSGFYKGREDFEKMTLGEVWFAWTEDPENEFARRLDRHRFRMLEALRGAERRLRANANPAAENLRELLGFFEVEEGDFGVSTRDARNAIRDRVPKERRRYLEPKKKVLTLPGVEGVRIFVLGPPVDEKLLEAADPTGEEGEVYEGEGHELRLASGELLGVGAAGKRLAFNTVDDSRAEAGQPFAGDHRIPFEQVRARPDLHPFFHEHYGFGEDDAQAWRRVDAYWQDPSESLALKLDSATNNTSLVLAIELWPKGPVLLFPGDAQVGNWKSWHEGSWSGEEDGLEAGEEITAKDLLERTVLYKVGHHGSHNATLRDQGLRMMTSPDLTAMIPVDEEWARSRRPHAWKMPFDPLYEDLLERTRGRILRTDTGLIERPEDTSKKLWKAFEKRIAVEDFWIDLEIPLERG